MGCCIPKKVAVTLAAAETFGESQAFGYLVCSKYQDLANSWCSCFKNDEWIVSAFLGFLPGALMTTSVTQTCKLSSIEMLFVLSVVNR